MKQEDRIKEIKKQIYACGLYPALLILKEQQDKENYENCVIMKRAIDDVAKGREWYLDSKVNGKSFDVNLKSIIDKMSNPIPYLKNMPLYLSKFRNALSGRLPYYGVPNFISKDNN